MIAEAQNAQHSTPGGGVKEVLLPPTMSTISRYSGEGGGVGIRDQARLPPHPPAVHRYIECVQLYSLSCYWHHTTLNLTSISPSNVNTFVSGRISFCRPH